MTSGRVISGSPSVSLFVVISGARYYYWQTHLSHVSGQKLQRPYVILVRARVFGQFVWPFNDIPAAV
jgi:hypothetical protein